MSSLRNSSRFYVHIDRIAAHNRVERDRRVDKLTTSELGILLNSDMAAFIDMSEAKERMKTKKR